VLESKKVGRTLREASSQRSPLAQRPWASVDSSTRSRERKRAQATYSLTRDTCIKLDSKACSDISEWNTNKNSFQKVTENTLKISLFEHCSPLMFHNPNQPLYMNLAWILTLPLWSKKNNQPNNLVSHVRSSKHRKQTQVLCEEYTLYPDYKYSHPPPPNIFISLLFSFFFLFLFETRSTYVARSTYYVDWALVAHACNPTYSGGRDPEDCSSKSAW
jgi:hypothetical protein